MGKARETGIVDSLRPAPPPPHYLRFRADAMLVVRAACRMNQRRAGLEFHGLDGQPLGLWYVVLLEQERAYIDPALARDIAERLNRLMERRARSSTPGGVEMIRPFAWSDVVYAPENEPVEGTAHHPQCSDLDRREDERRRATA